MENLDKLLEEEGIVDENYPNALRYALVKEIYLLRKLLTKALIGDNGYEETSRVDGKRID